MVEIGFAIALQAGEFVVIGRDLRIDLLPEGGKDALPYRPAARVGRIFRLLK